MKRKVVEVRWYDVYLSPNVPYPYVTQDLIQYFWKNVARYKSLFSKVSPILMEDFAYFSFTSAAYLSTKAKEWLTLYEYVFLFIFSHFQGCLLQNLC